MPFQSAHAASPAAGSTGFWALQRAVQALATARLPMAERATLPFVTSAGDLTLLASDSVPFLRHTVAVERRHCDLAPHVQ